jgi:hypothetical protein
MSSLIDSLNLPGPPGLVEPCLEGANQPQHEVEPVGLATVEVMACRVVLRGGVLR